MKRRNSPHHNPQASSLSWSPHDLPASGFGNAVAAFLAADTQTASLQFCIASFFTDSYARIMKASRWNVLFALAVFLLSFRTTQAQSEGSTPKLGNDGIINLPMGRFFSVNARLKTDLVGRPPIEKLDSWPGQGSSLMPSKYTVQTKWSMNATHEKVISIQATFYVLRSLLSNLDKGTVRVFDVITNSSNHTQKVTLSYSSHWESQLAYRNVIKMSPIQGSVPDLPLGYYVEHFENGPDFVPLLILGLPPKGWERKDTSTPESFQWEYTGTIGPGKRVLLFHWLAMKKDEDAEAATKIAETLVRDGLPVDPTLAPGASHELINFYFNEDRTRTPSSTRSVEVGVHNYFIEKLRKRHQVTPDPNHEKVILKNGPVLKGKLKIKGLQIDARDFANLSDLDSIAALQGSSAPGGKMVVYHRSGSVIPCNVSWEEATLTDPALGSFTVKADSIKAIFWRDNTLTKVEPGPTSLIVHGAGGLVTPLAELPSVPFKMNWQAGELNVPWNMISGLRQQSPPNFGYQVFLTDGSQFVAWTNKLSDKSLPPLIESAASTWQNLVDLESDKFTLSKKPEVGLTTQEGSIIGGTWAEANLPLYCAGTEVRIVTADIRNVTVKPGRGTEPDCLIEVRTSSDVTLTGTPVNPTLPWKWLDEVHQIQWPQIRKIACESSQKTEQGATNYASPQTTNTKEVSKP